MIFDGAVSIRVQMLSCYPYNPQIISSVFEAMMWLTYVGTALNFLKKSMSFLYMLLMIGCLPDLKAKLSEIGGIR